VTELTLTSQIRVAFHPAPEAELVHGNWNVPVQIGPLGWMDSVGWRHEL
jgi:hypothetical protein